MISASDVPACPACGAREVHPITKIHESQFINPLTRQVEVTATNETLFACRQCGRDVTDAWKDVQPAPKVKPLIGVDLADEADRTVVTVVEPHALGIGATNGSKS